MCPHNDDTHRIDRAELERLLDNQHRRQLGLPGRARPPDPPTPEEVEEREYCDALMRRILKAETDPVRFKETITRGDRYNVK